MMGVGLCNSYCRLWILFWEVHAAEMLVAGFSCMVHVAAIMRYVIGSRECIIQYWVTQNNLEWGEGFPIVLYCWLCSKYYLALVDLIEVAALLNS